MNAHLLSAIPKFKPKSDEQFGVMLMDDPMKKLEEWWATEGINLSHKDACIAAFKLGLSVHEFRAATEANERPTEQ